MIRRATRTSAQYSQMAKNRWLAKGTRIPHDTTDVLQAIRHEIWTRELSVQDVAKRIGIPVGKNGNAGMLSRVLSGQQNLLPSMLDRIIAAAKITPARARHLHALGAAKAGWRVRG